MCEVQRSLQLGDDQSKEDAKGKMTKQTAKGSPPPEEIFRRSGSQMLLTTVGCLLLHYINWIALFQTCLEL